MLVTFTSFLFCWFVGRKYEFLKLAEPLMKLAVFLSHNPNGRLVVVVLLMLVVGLVVVLVLLLRSV